LLPVDGEMRVLPRLDSGNFPDLRAAIAMAVPRKFCFCKWLF
jgi:hypothetical protein